MEQESYIHIYIAWILEKEIHTENELETEQKEKIQQEAVENLEKSRNMIATIC